VTTARAERRPRRRSRRSRPVYWLGGLVVAALIFWAGIAVGEALHDNPTPGITQTSVQTIHP
jgi:hypothetical protein